MIVYRVSKTPKEVERINLMLIESGESFFFFPFYLFTNSLFALALVPTYFLCLNII